MTRRSSGPPGFGFQDRAKKIPATAETVYRVGSVSKLFTDVAIMQLVEEGKLDLDAPVAKYIPDFKPVYKEGQKPITLRMLMAHRSGLIRESPIGNYFDPTEPTLEEDDREPERHRTRLPSRRTDEVFQRRDRPGRATRFRRPQNEQYEKLRAAPRARSARHDSRVRSRRPPEVKKHLADAVMWTYHGREFPAPTFELGTPPAGCMYSTVLDLAKFQSCLFADGKLGGKQLLKPETIAEMFRPQFAEDRRPARLRPRLRGRRLGREEADRPRRRDLRLRDRVRGAAEREARRDRGLGRAMSSNAV